jgi:RNA polymerase sigma-70 factor (ECF subfamily)
MAGQDSVAHVSEPLHGVRALVPAMPPFAVVYQQYLDFVWSSVRHLGIGSESIDDVVQEVFIVIHAKLHTLRQPEALRSWIYGVVRRTVSTHRRAQRVKETSGAAYQKLEASAGSASTTPLEVAEQNAQLELLSSLLAEIDEPKREIFILAELQEMTVPEIAEALEIPLNTAYSRLRAARQAFEVGLARHSARVSDEGQR